MGRMETVPAPSDGSLFRLQLSGIALRYRP